MWCLTYLFPIRFCVNHYIMKLSLDLIKLCSKIMRQIELKIAGTTAIILLNRLINPKKPKTRLKLKTNTCTRKKLQVYRHTYLKTHIHLGMHHTHTYVRMYEGMPIKALVLKYTRSTPISSGRQHLNYVRYLGARNSWTKLVLQGSLLI